MLATPTTIDNVEKTRPLSPEEIRLINTSFKPQYQRPMYIWALLAKNSKRRHLFGMLRCEKEGQLTTRSTSAEVFECKPEFVIRSSLYTINLNKALSKDQFRKKDPRFYRSQIKEEGILTFNNLNTVKQSSVQRASTSLSNLYAKQLFNSDFLIKFGSLAETYTPFLKEIIEYTETKANFYPVSNLKNTTLDPYNESQLISKTFKEDHFIKPKVVVKSTNPSKFSGEGSRPATTMYTEDFSSNHFQNSFRPTKILQPLENPHPFSQFPTVKQTEKLYTDDEVKAQTRENQTMSRLNRCAFTSKTVL